ncbi:MAG TPA: succinate dehydrogenase, cytochrome b556 subunit [Chloroflexota bacterium]|nr:succinate dehydrogenase, cytochrome b556 subunit [Chloroflexota bacterium]
MTDTPIQHESRWRRALRGWFDPRGGGIGFIAFALNRITGLALVVYLFMHLVVLSSLIRGEAAWTSFLTLARTPLFFFFDVALFAALLYHALNGIRVTLIGLGIGVRLQQALFYGVTALSVVLLAAVTWLMATV